MIIHTHRDLVDAIGSQCSLSGRIAAKFRSDLDLHEVGDFWLDYSKIGMDRGLKAKERLPASQVYDLRLSDLHADPLNVIADIYNHFDLPFDDTLAAQLQARIADEPKQQHGEHEYDIADFGLTAERIHSTFADYRQRFGV
ncbi:MAG: sulfotransferase [Polyangiales bacterium]